MYYSFSGSSFDDLKDGEAFQTNDGFLNWADHYLKLSSAVVSQQTIKVKKQMKYHDAMTTSVRLCQELSH